MVQKLLTTQRHSFATSRVHPRSVDYVATFGPMSPHPAFPARHQNYHNAAHLPSQSTRGRAILKDMAILSALSVTAAVCVCETNRTRNIAPCWPKLQMLQADQSSMLGETPHTAWNLWTGLAARTHRLEAHTLNASPHTDCKPTHRLSPHLRVQIPYTGEKHVHRGLDPTNRIHPHTYVHELESHTGLESHTRAGTPHIWACKQGFAIRLSDNRYKAGNVHM